MGLHQLLPVLVLKSLQHQGSINAVAIQPRRQDNPDRYTDWTARLWDAVTGQPIGRELEHQGSVDAVAFSPDGKIVLTGSTDWTARLWDATTGMPTGKPLVHKGSVVGVAFSPNGEKILTASENGIARLWEVATGQPTSRHLTHKTSVDAVAFSPDGRTIMTGSVDGTLRFLDAATGVAIGRPLALSDPAKPSDSEYHQSVEAAAFSPDGETVVTGCLDGTLRLLESPAQLPDDPVRLSAWIEALTGLELDEQGDVHVLDSAAWRQRRDQLEQLGGPPPTSTKRLLRTMLLRPDPTDVIPARDIGNAR